ncbi:signal peptidase I [Kytococcus sp. Marseille-QA3725]
MALVVGVAVLAGLTVRTYRVSGPSMEPTHSAGDLVVATTVGGITGSAEDGLAVGDVVVVDATAAWGDHRAGAEALHVVKRVVGEPGDRVSCCTDGAMTRNGRPVEPHGPGGEGLEQRFDVLLGPGEWWVVGDNAAQSNDSRTHLAAPGGGVVRSDEVVARVRWAP